MYLFYGSSLQVHNLNSLLLFAVPDFVMNFHRQEQTQNDLLCVYRYLLSVRVLEKMYNPFTRLYFSHVTRLYSRYAYKT